MPDLTDAIAALDQAVAALMAAGGSPGVAVAITDRDQTLYIGSYGFADIATRTPVTPETLFEIGSIGKSLAADVLLSLSEDGIVDLQAPVTDYLPWFMVRSRFAPITLHHLLSHTAGIVAGNDASPDAHGEILALAETETATPPGERFHYSNVGYKTLGLVIAAVTGRSAAEVIGERVLQPLGMASAEPAITHELRPRIAVGYTGLYDDRPYHVRHPLVPATWVETDTADGSIVATAGDLACYARMLLNRGATPHGRLLSEAAFSRKIAPVSEYLPGIGYGYGVITREVDGHTVVGHTGGMPGYAAHLLADLDGGLGVAVLVNGAGSPGLIARYTLALLRAGRENGPLLSAPSWDVAAEDLVAYTGTFSRREGAGPNTLAFEIDANHLVLRHGEACIPLGPAGDDAFLADHPAFDRFPLRFERDADGAVVAVTHGGSWYAHSRHRDEPAPAHPPAWDAYPGHYRAHNPWCPSFRVVRRRGCLWLIFPVEPDGFEEEQPLVPLAEPGHFRAGDDPGGPERLRFDAVIAGQALCATLSGGVYSRFFTP